MKKRVSPNGTGVMPWPSRPLVSRSLAAMAVMMVGACSSHVIEDVDYTVYRHPNQSFEKLNFLGVSLIKGITPRVTNMLVDMIETCGHYPQVNKIDAAIAAQKTDRREVAQELSERLKGIQDGRYVHGLLAVEVVSNKQKSWKKNATLVTLKDLKDHEWLDSYGNAGHPANPLFGQEAIAPKRVTSSKRVPVTGARQEIVVRYVLYNKIQDKVVLDKKTSITSAVTHYSKKAALKAKPVSRLLFEQLFRRIVRDVCPEVAKVERQLVSAKTASEPARLTQMGIELAEDEQWEKAADEWRKAVLVDKGHAPALHNLGVYYERSGQIPLAMEEFSKARVAKKKNPAKALFVPDQYDTSLSLFRPSFGTEDIEPRIYTVSGSNWITILGGDFETGDVLNVYRSRKMAKAPDFRVLGMDLLEVGRIRVLKTQGEFTLARMLEFLEPFRIESGDLIMAR